MEGAWDPGAGAEEPSGVMGVERAEGRRGNWGEPPRPRRCGWREARLAYNRRSREVAGGREAVGAGRSSADRRGNTTRRERRARASSMHGEDERDSVSAELKARSVSRADGVDRVRALQRVLYRCAKQDRDRRFHALFDKSPAATSCAGRGTRSVLTAERPASMV